MGEDNEKLKGKKMKDKLNLKLHYVETNKDEIHYAMTCFLSQNKFCYTCFQQKKTKKEKFSIHEVTTNFISKFKTNEKTHLEVSVINCERYKNFKRRLTVEKTKNFIYKNLFYNFELCFCLLLAFLVFIILIG